jgi:16S rRNA (cytosine967-C5)-methyltransferase
MTPSSPPARRSAPRSSHSRNPRPPNPQGLAARKAALALIDAALERRRGMEDSEGEALAGLEGRDRGFARALALATLRWLGPIDRALAARLQRAPPPAVTRLLRLGAAQMLALDTPAHAAVSTTLALAGEDREARPFIKLINAVLRGIDRERPAPEPEHFAPDWLFARWRAAYGEPVARAIAARIAEEPPTDLSLHDPAEAQGIAEAIGGVVLPGPTVRTAQRGDISLWPGFADGRWWVQDAAAALPARLLCARPAQAALDLCAAPGGKTLQLAAAGAKVTALDRSSARLERVRANLERTRLDAELVAADGAAWADERLFDAVLLDAPCSATGTFRRHPDVLWTSRPADIAALARTQSVLFDAAARRVRPGGRLVYCVCSLEPEEGEAQVAAFLSRRPDMALDPITPGEGGAPEAALTSDGALRILPSMDPPAGGLDGFYVARFLRHG